MIEYYWMIEYQWLINIVTFWLSQEFVSFKTSGILSNEKWSIKNLFNTINKYI